MLTFELEARAAAEAEDDFMIPGTFWARIEHQTIIIIHLATQHTS